MFKQIPLEILIKPKINIIYKNLWKMTTGYSKMSFWKKLLKPQFSDFQQKCNFFKIFKCFYDFPFNDIYPMISHKGTIIDHIKHIFSESAVSKDSKS